MPRAVGLICLQPGEGHIWARWKTNDAWTFDDKCLLHGMAISAALRRFWNCLVTLKAGLGKTVIFVTLRWYTSIKPGVTKCTYELLHDRRWL